jgi:hypothetical protein
VVRRDDDGPWVIAAPEPEERARPLLLATGQNAGERDSSTRVMPLATFAF